jgi:hypothetical protein
MVETVVTGRVISSLQENKTINARSSIRLIMVLKTTKLTSQPQETTYGGTTNVL